MNLFTGVGRLVRDPEVKELKGGKQLCNFSVAISRAYNREQTDFINCVVWGKSAEYFSKYGKKGQLISIQGELNIDKVGDKYFTKVNVAQANILTTKQDMQGGGHQATYQNNDTTTYDEPTDDLEPKFDTFEADFNAKTNDNEFDLVDEDELPF